MYAADLDENHSKQTDRLVRSSSRVVLAGLVLCALCLASCASSSSSPGAKPHVVVAESPWGAVARAVAGSDAQVTSVIENPNVDPHEYTPTAQVAAEVAEADVVVDNGLGYDAFMGSLLSTGASHRREVVTAAQVLGLSGSGTNPHLWYSIDRVPFVAAAIAKALSSVDPAHGAAYAANLERFDVSLEPLDAAIAQIRAARRGARLAQTERVAGYLLAQAGLTVASPTAFSLAIESGQEPDASATDAMRSLLDDHGVDVLIENTETVSPVTNQVVAEARAAKIPVVGVSELVEPKGTSFVSWQARQIEALGAALGVRVSA
jgi:zinc/manganese transport system substrate-binding protein